MLWRNVCTYYRYKTMQLDRKEGVEMLNIEKDVKDEIKKAESKFAEYNSYHEEFAIIMIEVDELWDLVKAKAIAPKQHYDEAKQIACTAIRYMKMCKNKHELK
jgi:hypothetical protein